MAYVFEFVYELSIEYIFGMALLLRCVWNKKRFLFEHGEVLVREWAMCVFLTCI